MLAGTLENAQNAHRELTTKCSELVSQTQDAAAGTTTSKSKIDEYLA